MAGATDSRLSKQRQGPTSTRGELSGRAGEWIITSTDIQPMTQPKIVRPRPAILRALGADDPPPAVEIDGITYQRVVVFKHDSLAATALYENSGRRIVCKFNRRQPFWGLSILWLGRFLARHEAAVLRRLSDVPNIPRLRGDVSVAGALCANAVAHDYIPGHPLGYHEFVGDQFFPILERTLMEMHARNVAYADMNKRENVIVGDDGSPYLVDFQISVLLYDRWPGGSRMARTLLEWLKASDRYHLKKHYARSRPDLLGLSSRDLPLVRPWWIRAFRLLATPVRKFRRLALVALRVRSGRGLPDSEHFAEEGARRDAALRGRERKPPD